MIFVCAITAILIVASPTSSTGCNQSCGGAGEFASRRRLIHPFGFSEGCGIRLNCSENGTMKIGDFHVQNVTSNSIFVDLPVKCNRPIESIKPLFDHHYALTLQNNLILQNCSSQAKLTGCMIPTSMVDLPVTLPGCDDNLTCYSQERRGDTQFLSYENVTRTECRVLVSSIAVNSGVSFEMSRVELGWWLDGRCKCSNHANCTEFRLPDDQFGFRCQCLLGYHGDGFADGDGCRKSQTAGTMSNLLKLLIGIGACIFLITIFSRRILSSNNFIASWKRNRKNDHKVEVFIRQHESLGPKRYSYSDIKKITNSFKIKLGQGGYGGVYKGKLLDGSLVAVKVLKESKGNGEEFINEVASISRTSHVNVVTLLGFCFEGCRRALIYEFMPNGSLEKFIYGGNPSILDDRNLGWEKLYHIAIGIARGLEYLHLGCNTRILHFDIKPHNILLGEDFCPKIADFGLAKLCLGKESIISMMGARGTIGYIAPEVYNRNFGGVSHKSDIYSYGSMILEMVGGRKNINVGVSKTSEIYFPYWVYKRLELDNDFILETVMTEEENGIARKMVLVGLWCIQTDPSQRPSISKVLDMLEGSIDALQIPPKPFLSSPPNRES